MRWKLAAALAALVVLVPAAVRAFCGFYVSGADGELFNNATMVVMMRDGTKTVLSMQNNYQGPPQDFAMVVPVPVVLQEDMVKTLPREVFERVDRLAAPRLVEYWEEDPCAVPKDYDRRSRVMKSSARPRGRQAEEADDLGVTIEAQFTVGEYEVVILSARDSGGLDTWLRREQYKIPAGAEPLLRPYVEGGWKFFVAKVDVEKVKFENGQAMLSPLRFHYDTDEFRLPVRLGLMNSAGTQDLLVHILARGQRYEVANYANVTIPTNIDVDDMVRDEFGAFYVSLFDATLEKNKGAVVTEYSWDASSCDPCPTPALREDELMTLGADVVLGHYEPARTRVAPTAGAPARRRRPSRPRSFIARDFVLTRLHARYDKTALGEDLIFKEAPPIAGGREWRSGPENTLENGAVSSGRNQFQGRYAIRHEWTGPMECEKPVRGRWGGPPAGLKRAGGPRAAMDLAFAPRGTVKLERLVKQDIPEIGLKVGAASAPSVAGAVAGAEPGQQATGQATQRAAKKKGSCGCRTDTGGGVSGALWLVALAWWVRRRRCATRLS